MNPAVSLDLAVPGRFSCGQSPGHRLAQVLGGLAGAVVLCALDPDEADVVAGGFASNSYRANSPGGYGLFAAFPIGSGSQPGS